jgi:hypothetical protein
MRALLLALALWSGAAVADERIAVIVAEEARLSRVGVDDLRDLYLGRPSPLADRWQPLVLPAGDPARERFDRSVLGMTPEQFTNYWVQQRIRGAPVAPRQVASASLMRDTVQSMPSAIGYVPERLAGGLRVVTVAGTNPDVVVAGIEAAEGGSLSPERQAAVLVRAILYDRNRDEDELRITVLFDGGTPGAERRALRLVDALSRSDAPLPVRATAVPWAGPERLAELAARQRGGVLYVSPELNDRVAAITEVTRAAGVFTVAGRRELVERGLCAGVYLEGLRSRLVVNPHACESEGVRLSASLLRVATRVH